jgi:hypothetical protein
LRLEIPELDETLDEKDMSPIIQIADLQDNTVEEQVWRNESMFETYEHA